MGCIWVSLCFVLVEFVGFGGEGFLAFWGVRFLAFFWTKTFSVLGFLGLGGLGCLFF